MEIVEILEKVEVATIRKMIAGRSRSLEVSLS
jgi:hypothetical protein